MVSIQTKDRYGNVLGTTTFTVEEHFSYLWQRECDAHRSYTCHHWVGACLEGIALQEKLFRISLDVLTCPDHRLDVDLSTFDKII